MSFPELYCMPLFALLLKKNDNQTLKLSYLRRHFSPGSVFVCMQLSLGHHEMF